MATITMLILIPMALADLFFILIPTQTPRLLRITPQLITVEAMEARLYEFQTEEWFINSSETENQFDQSFLDWQLVKKGPQKNKFGGLRKKKKW